MRSHDPTAVPFADKLIGAWQETVKPVVGFVAESKETDPLNPKVLFREKEIACPESPELKSLPAATIRKSPTRIATDAWWDAVPGDPEPVILTM